MQQLLLGFLCSLLLIPAVKCVCTDSRPSAHLFFRCQLSLQDFSFSDSTVGDVFVLWRVQKVGFAGAPEWIQSDLSSSRQALFLFGTPGEEDVGDLELQVIVWRNDFQMSSVHISLTIEPLQGQIAQFSEFYITNLNLEEILLEEQYGQLNTTLWGVFPVQGDSLPLVLALIHPQDRNIETPLPPNKIGVVVQATPGLNVDARLSIATQQQINTLQGTCGSFADTLAPPPLTFDQFRAHGFVVDWCQYSLVEVSDSTATTPSVTTPTLLLATPTDGRSIYVLIIVAVVVCVVMCVSVCALACIFFSTRKQSLTISKSRRVKNSRLLEVTRSSVLDVSRAQVILRSLSAQEDSTVITSPLEGLAALEERPIRLSEIDLQEETTGKTLTPSPPPYQYNETLMDTTRSTLPSR